MPESTLHKRLRNASESWLRENGCAIVMQEPTTVGRNTDRDRPDVIGIVTDHLKVCPELGWKKWDVIEIESEPDLRGVVAEARKIAGRGYGYVSVANWTYLLHPSDFEPADYIVHSDWGRLEYVGDGAIRTTDRPARWTTNNPYTLTPLLASMILNLQRETGKQAQEARSSHGARLSAKDIQKVHDCLVTLHDELAPDTPLRAICNHTGIDRKKLLKACKAGIPGFKYDAEQQTLMIEEPATASK